LGQSGKARSEHIPSGLLPTADIVDAFWHFRFVPSADHLPVPSRPRSAWFVGVLMLMVYLIFAMTLYLLPPRS